MVYRYGELYTILELYIVLTTHNISHHTDENMFLQVVEDGYEFFAKRQLVTLFSAPNYCGEFDNAGAMMSVDETLMCSFQVSLCLITCCYLFCVYTGS